RGGLVRRSRLRTREGLWEWRSARGPPAREGRHAHEVRTSGPRYHRARRHPWPRLGRLRQQPARGPGPGCARKLGPGPNGLPAARRPRAQPGGDRQGVRGAGADRPRGGHAWPGERGWQEGDPRDPERPRAAEEVPGSAEPAERRPEPPVGDRGTLSGAQVEPELPGAPEPAGGNREPGRLRATPLQRDRASVQYGGPKLPVGRRGVVPGLSRAPLLRGRARQRGRPADQVLAAPDRMARRRHGVVTPPP